ncbi:30S ribosomal protein S21 [Candidatus Saccharibacteria bacterium]|nr:30S ribosomal protein S21 [Candidatus Saccharibacteria bacterium]
MLQVSRKDDESVESLIRRFNKKVAQSGVLTEARRKKYFEKPLSKKEQREIAIRKRARKEAKTRELLGIR